MHLLLLAMLGLGLALLFWLFLNPSLETPGPRLVGVAGLAVLPVLVSLGGVGHKLEQSKQTDFCLACHEMDAYGQSLWVDDASSLAASHFQNARVPRDHACYACHTTYTMYGDLQAKWTGLRHLLVHYAGPARAAGEIALYRPYENRECLYCHDGARSFLEEEEHLELLGELRANEESCLTCHDGDHEAEAAAGRTPWKPAGGNADGSH